MWELLWVAAERLLWANDTTSSTGCCSFNETVIGVTRVGQWTPRLHCCKRFPFNNNNNNNNNNWHPPQLLHSKTTILSPTATVPLNKNNKNNLQPPQLLHSKTKIRMEGRNLQGEFSKEFLGCLCRLHRSRERERNFFVHIIHGWNCSCIGGIQRVRLCLIWAKHICIVILVLSFLLIK